jgi:phosphatidyl-myo-inositol dimannoside synthase
MKTPYRSEAQPFAESGTGMKIPLLLVTELFPPAIGGSAVLFQEIYSRLPGADMRVLTKRWPKIPPGHQQENGFSIHRELEYSGRWGVIDPSALGIHLRAARQIRRLLPRRAGIVHCGRALPEGVTALLARAAGGPCYACWAHGEDLSTALASREFTLLMKVVYRHAEFVLANSQNTAAMLTDLGVSPRKIQVVYPAVDCARFNPEVDGADVRRQYAGDEDILLLSVGRLQRRKGHDVAIRAMNALRNEFHNLRYVIVGDGEERGRLEQLAVQFGLTDRVFFAGNASSDRLPAFYSACDLFLMPNRVDNGDIEGFGIVFLEAAAAGKPSIGGRSGGVPEAVEHGRTGLLVDGSDEQSVASAIRTLVRCEEQRHRFGAHGLARVREEFNWNRAAAIVERLQFDWAQRALAANRLSQVKTVEIQQPRLL